MKNRLFVVGWLAVGLAVALLLGCTPPAARALLEGKRYLDEGNYPKAIARLQTATASLKTNAHAWNYLGLAYHASGSPLEAVEAYRTALKLDQDYVEVHFNLGCLCLEQNRADLAKPELIVYTLRRQSEAAGFLKLGHCHLQLREFAAAEKSFSEAVRLDPDNADALSGLGLTRFHRGQPKEAAKLLESALKLNPEHESALVNLAIINHQSLTNKATALQRYREYVAAGKAQNDLGQVAGIIRQLEQDLSPPPVSDVAASAPRRPSPPGKFSIISDSPAVILTNKPPAVAQVRSQEVARVEKPVVVTPPPSAPKAVVRPPAPRAKTAPPTASVPAQVVRLDPEPPVKAAVDVAVPKSESIVGTPNVGTGKIEDRVIVAPAPAAEPGEFEDNKWPQYPKYAYQKPTGKPSGDRGEAEKVFSRGAEAERLGQLDRAKEAYRQAIEADPSYYDAYYNLALVSLRSGDLKGALSASELALAIRPESLDARYNFAIALRRSSFPRDAAREFETLLRQHPKDSRVHFGLASLYSQELQDIPKAREHYEKSLEIAPAQPQAAAIRFWLKENPR